MATVNPTINQCVRVAKAIAMSEEDPVARAQAVHGIVTSLMDLRREAADDYALATYMAQRSLCECGASFGEPFKLRAHQKDVGEAGHDTRQFGVSYANLAGLLGVNQARIQQLISRGREVHAMLTPEAAPAA